MTDMTTRRTNRTRSRTAAAQAQRALERLGLKPAPAEPLRRQAAVEFIRLYRGVAINEKQLQRWVRQGRIPGAYRWGTQWRFPPEALVRWLDSQGIEPNDAA